MKFYQVSLIDNEDNCTYKLFPNKKEADNFIKQESSQEYGEIVSETPQVLNLESTRKIDILNFINNLSY